MKTETEKFVDNKVMSEKLEIENLGGDILISQESLATLLEEYKDLFNQSDEEIGNAADEYAFQVPYDGTNCFYNKDKHKSFQDGAKWR